MFIGLILLIGVVTYFLLINENNSKLQFSNSKNPEEMLKERYVNGEIDEITFRKMKETLNN